MDGSFRQEFQAQTGNVPPTSKDHVLPGGAHLFRFDTRRVNIRGEDHTFYVLPHPGAVGIIAFEHEKIALIKQYRPAIDQTILEIPAGVLEPGEDPHEAATRELAEETGLRARTLTRLGGLYATPGYSAEYLHIFLATNLTLGETQFDAGEQIDELVWLSLHELSQAITQGEVEDSKTIAALYLLQQHLTTVGSRSSNN